MKTKTLFFELSAALLNQTILKTNFTCSSLLTATKLSALKNSCQYSKRRTSKANSKLTASANFIDIPKAANNERQIRHGTYEGVAYTVFLKEQNRGKRDSQWLFVEILRTMLHKPTYVFV